MTQTLDNKIRSTELVLEDVLKTATPDGVRVAWTGGKDSTVVLYIWNALLVHYGLGPVRAINLDTGCKFPEIIAFRDRLAAEWGVDLHVARPVGEMASCEPAMDVVECCRKLKVEPLKKALVDTGATHLITGIRRDEHPDRAERLPVEERSEPAHMMINPILDWTETEIWAFHARFDLPHCELYDLGYRSLGCQPCTSLPKNGQGERAGREKTKEKVMETLTSLGYF